MFRRVEESLPGSLLTREKHTGILSRNCSIRRVAGSAFAQDLSRFERSEAFSFYGLSEAPVSFAITNPFWEGKRVTNMQAVVRRVLVVLFWIFVPAAAFAQEPFGINPSTMTNTGVSGIWILANISYAGMRAQGSEAVGWRIVAFIFGFPGTLLTFLVVSEGRGSAYGIHLPAANDDND